MPNCQYYPKEKTLPLNSQIPFLLFHLHCSFLSMIYRFYVSSLQKATVIPNEKRTDKSTIYTCLSGARKCSTHEITLHRVELNSNDRVQFLVSNNCWSFHSAFFRLRCRRYIRNLKIWNVRSRCDKQQFVSMP